MSDGSQLYDATYYRCHCGPDPYERTDAWLGFFGNVADHLVRSLQPRTVFDAGCAWGFLVESFWDRGVEASGIDISDYAIAQVRRDMQPFCQVGSLTAPLSGRYDLVTCIEVLEHMPADEAERAIANLAAITDTILFSSSPTDFEEETHFNVRPTISWLKIFNDHSFSPDLTYDASFLTPHAILFRQQEQPEREDVLISFSEKIRLRLALTERSREAGRLNARLTQREQEIAEIQTELSRHATGAKGLGGFAAAADELEIERLQAQIGQLQELLAQTQSAISDRDRELGYRQGEASTTAQEAERLRQEIARLLDDHDKLRRRHHRSFPSKLWRQIRPSAIAKRIEKRASKLGRKAPTPELPTISAHTLPTASDEEIKLISSSSLFDRDWYLEQYPDVALAGLEPAAHYLNHGATEGRDPGPGFNSHRYLTLYPAVAAANMNPLVHYLRHGRTEGRSINASNLMPFTAALAVTERFPALAPLPVFAVPGMDRRVVMVTDSVNAGSLYGGVGTALILSALLAERLGVALCVATRTEPAAPDSISNVLKLQNIPLPSRIEVIHAAPGSANMPVGDDDIFVTTSWWSTEATLKSIPAEHIVYILQEDERMFYPFGDDHLRCTEVMANPALRYVINSHLLFTHLTSDGFSNIASNGSWFEPAFPESNYFWQDSQRTDGRFNFLFYARPNNLRNLYYRGLEALDAALAANILDPEEWNISFVGKDLKKITLSRGVRPSLLQNMSWADYAKLIRSTDLGLSLMYTPHPSYPPLDLAASGAAVVTNRFPGKPSLSAYSENIISSDLDVSSLVEAISNGAQLAKDIQKRRGNYANHGIQRDWAAALKANVDKILGN